MRRRKREPEQRQHRTHPRFSDAEWAALTAAAKANHCKPGTFTALATVLAAGHDDPRAAVADFRTGIQRLGEATTALSRIGNLLNQETRHLHQGGGLFHAHERLLARLEEAIDTVEDTAVAAAAGTDVIVKPIQVRDFAYKTVRYLFGPGRHNEHTDPHLVASWNDYAPDPGRHPQRHTIGQLAARLDIPIKALPKHLRPEVKYLHIPVRAAPGDRHLTDDEWAHIARRILHTARLAPEGDDQACRWIAVRHAEDHIHLLATLVRQDGRTPDVPRKYIQVMRREVDRIEADLGLRRLNPGDGTAAKRPGHREHFKAHRTGRMADSARLRTTVRRALAASATIEELVTHLANHGVLANVARKPSGDIRGITFAHQPTDGEQPIWYSGSRLAPDLSLPKILGRLAAAEHFPTGFRPDDPWRHAARTLRTLPDLLDQEDEQAAADHIHAFGALLDAAAQTAPTPGRAELRQAAAAFERATRTHKEANYQAGRALRELAYQITRTPATGETGAWLLCAAIAAVIAITRWHHARHHQQQEAAARQALTHLRAAYQHTAAAPLAAITAHAPHPRITAYWETRIHTLLPETADRITTDPTWPALATTLHHAHLAGISPESLITTDDAAKELTNTDNPVALLLWRLRDQQAEQQHARNTAARSVRRPVPNLGLSGVSNRRRI
ncbi:mobilization protein [Streptomyces sp. PT12]|uniref:mobilization protein n=1 Tax=Streptomyces sp. PT12 TaxID=1510197 RepID=UPI000DE42980|nr:mobilization protein [Streptomyces sp. PT12]RBM05333.1 mobilization protein [Streptomyces sp. PT12]